MLQNHVTSLEISKKLKELGFPQRSEFKSCGGHTYYEDDEVEGKLEACPEECILDKDEYCHSAGLVCEFTIARFLASELGEWLPDGVESESMGGSQRETFTLLKKPDNSWYAGYGADYRNSGDTQQEAMALVLIELTEKGIIDPKKL